MKKKVATVRSIAMVLILAMIITCLAGCSGSDSVTPEDAKVNNDDITIDPSNSTDVSDPSVTDTAEREKVDSVPETVSSTEKDNAEDKKQEEKEKAISENNMDENKDTRKDPNPFDNTVVKTVPEVEHVDDDVEGLTGALAFVRKLRLGWNLGNTMDATSGATTGANLSLESSWSGIKTTREMIDAIKEAGFKSVRIPVSWHNHVDKDYNIEAPWLARVRQIVDYVIENDMYCTINIHHDNSTEFIYPTTEYLEQSKNYLRRIWEQVGEEFKEYDDHLIFESLNEPRLVGNKNEWYLSDNEICHDAVRCINELNQLFVDTIRAQGGNNAERYLLVPAYAAQWGAATDDEFVMPHDSADNKLLLEVHAYSPENFSLTAPTESSSTDVFDETNGKSVGGINSMLAKLKLCYIDKGIGVVIDEFGSRDKDGNTADRVAHAAYYVKKAREAGITCFWWDNNLFSGSGERFGIFDRKSCSFRYPEIAQALADNCR